MHKAADLTAALAAVTAVRSRLHTASDDELLDDTDVIEQIGRVVDGLRIAAAAQIEHRSRKILGEESLAFQHGARDGVELVQLTTRIGGQEAKRRVGIGAALAPRMGFDGELLPGRFPELAAAVASGAVGVDAARMIVNLWKTVHLRADGDALAAAMDVLIRTAQATDEEGLREVVETYDLALDPDGTDPGERRQRRKRALKIGRTLRDGTTTISLVMTAEDLAMLKELLQSRRRNLRLVRTEAGSDDTDETLAPEWRGEDDCGTDPEFHEPRSRKQQDYDTVLESLALAARAEAEGIDGTAITHQTIITVTADEVEARQGRGWAPGIMAGLPMPVIERKACTGDLRLEVTGPKGEVLFLSREHRLFSAAQKVALVVAAGGRCQYSGCQVPHPYLEAHHAEWYARDGGETHIDNGIMLCSYHHHLVHAKDSPIEIRKHDGDLFIVPKRWSGDPDPKHRRQVGPIRDPRLLRLDPRRRPSPWAA